MSDVNDDRFTAAPEAHPWEIWKRERRLRMLAVSRDYALDIFSGKLRIAGLEFYHLVAVHFDAYTDSFVLCICGSTFEPVPQGNRIPDQPAVVYSTQNAVENRSGTEEGR